MPLLGIALVTGLSTSEPKPALPETPVMVAADTSVLSVEELDAAAITHDAIQPEVVAEPEPIFDRLSLTVSRGDTMEKLFRRNSLDIGHLMTIAQLDEAKQRFRRIKPGDVFEVTHDAGKIISLYSKLDLTNALQIERQEEGFTAQIIERPIEIRKRHAYGVIDSSLFESAAQAGLSDRTIMNVAGIFAWDVDFILDIRSGDNYYVQFEEIWQDGEFVTDGEIIAAEFNNNGREIRAIRFKDKDNVTDYFTPDGNSVRKAFIRAPVDFTRISSNFNPNRRHPILNTIRAHRGVDYAAPRGTPIKAAGDGKVIFRGNKSGYGKVVIVQHGGNITTLYAHMSSFAAKARVGSRVRQGQTIGYVGMTGLATANHLHYEYRLNGVHRNPRTVSLPDAEPIKAEYRQQFLTEAAPILEELEKFKSTQVASIAFNTQ
ncbi:MAG: peptidoglycan DD-metalloendopeptidase family protein [Gammaproteobacteria bacterium]|nr:peptidoglycan DD-metalloendopeptidase family protein [Gammaproteobacteria bacterium]MDH3778108.1 peptidoglycan DD-metalloendopeptidase family protein [Gammaproteobacteria bacterium]MDH3811798.1 peptidoglycan DD-metalloendopeptidase family protein [Gammaproteobacteria bacterium]